MATHGLARLVEVHRLGRDCRLTAARDVLDYFGFALSPAMVYGLSSSYSFTYRSGPGGLRSLLLPDLGDVTRNHFLPVSGHRLEVFENLAYLFNGTLVRGEGASFEELLGVLRGHLAEQIPVLVAVCQERVLALSGVSHTWPPYLNLSGFGGHWLQVVALDESRRTVTVLDSNRREPLELSFAALQEARAHGEHRSDFLMKSRGRWAVLMPSAAPPPLAERIRGALVKVVYHMSDTKSPAAHENGMEALGRFAVEFPAWPRELPRPKYKASLFMMRTTSDGLLSGSLGRRGFGIFLRRASAVLSHPPLADAALEYADAGAAWERLVQQIDWTVLDPATDAVLPEEAVSSLCAEIHARESAAFAKLTAAVSGL